MTTNALGVHDMTRLSEILIDDLVVAAVPKLSTSISMLAGMCVIAGAMGRRARKFDLPALSKTC